jgi:hypothetical protein
MGSEYLVVTQFSTVGYDLHFHDLLGYPLAPVSAAFLRCIAGRMHLSATRPQPLTL